MHRGIAWITAVALAVAPAVCWATPAPTIDPSPEARRSPRSASFPSAFPAGSDFGYSNAGYTVLALVIHEITGDCRDYMANEILTVDSTPTDAGFWEGEPAAQGPRAVGYLDSARTDVMGDFQGPHWAISGTGTSP